MSNDTQEHIGHILKQQRLSIPLTMHQLAAKAGISASHIGRIERGQRFPSGKILRKIAKPLGYEENELFTLAGYLTPHTLSIGEDPGSYTGRHIDPFVVRMLSQEPVEVQRHVISILNILKSLAKSASDTQNANK